MIKWNQVLSFFSTWLFQPLLLLLFHFNRTIKTLEKWGIRKGEMFYQEHVPDLGRFMTTWKIRSCVRWKALLNKTKLGDGRGKNFFWIVGTGWVGAFGLLGRSEGRVLAGHWWIINVKWVAMLVLKKEEPNCMTSYSVMRHLYLWV